jgi:hypothetical protein
MLFLLAVAAFSKFAAKRTRHTILVLRNRADDAAGTDILTHTLFLVNRTGAVTDDMARTHGEERQDDGMGSLCCVRPVCKLVLYDCSRLDRRSSVVPAICG